MSLSRSSGTSAMLFIRPSTFVSTEISPLKSSSMDMKSCRPCSSRKTLQVAGDSSENKIKKKKVAQNVYRKASCFQTRTHFYGLCMTSDCRFSYSCFFAKILTLLKFFFHFFDQIRDKTITSSQHQKKRKKRGIKLLM